MTTRRTDHHVTPPPPSRPLHRRPPLADDLRLARSSPSAVFALAGSFGGTPQDNWNIPDARAQVGIDQLREHTARRRQRRAPASSCTTATAPPVDAAVIAAADRSGSRRCRTSCSVSAAGLSADGDTALLTVQYDVPVTDPDLMGNLDAARPGGRRPPATPGLQVELGGDLPDTAAAPMRGSGELIGIVAALLILVLAFGSVVSAGLPIVVALVGLARRLGRASPCSPPPWTSAPPPRWSPRWSASASASTTPCCWSPGHVEYLRAGPRQASRPPAAPSPPPAARSCSPPRPCWSRCWACGWPGCRRTTPSASPPRSPSSCVAAAALTLVPALCGLAGRRLLPRKVRKGRAPDQGSPLDGALGHPRRPPPAGLGARCAASCCSRWPPPPWRCAPGRRTLSSQPSDLTTRKAYDLVADEFGPGANGPLMSSSTDRLDERRQVTALAAAGRRRATTSPRSRPSVTSPDGALRIFEAEPAFGPTDERTPGLVDDLRAEAARRVSRSPAPRRCSPTSPTCSRRGCGSSSAFVVAVSMLLLGMVFRSVVVPVKAAVMNLLSIGAAYGVLTAIFQWGWGAEPARPRPRACRCRAGCRS